MSKIKTKDIVKGTIKTIDKLAIATEKTKDNINSIKERNESIEQVKEQNSTEYATNRIESGTRKVVNNAGIVRIKGNNAVKTTKNNIIKTKNKIKNIKNRLAKKKKINATKKGIKTSKQVVKNTEKVAKETVKNSQRAIKIAQETAKKTYQGIKLTVKATITTVKAIIATTKALIAAIIAGGWIAIIIVIVICLIGLLCSSVFGIFFSSEDTGSIPMSSVVSDLNKELTKKITNIQNTNEYDDCKIEYNRAEWKEIIALYSVTITKGINEVDVLTIDDTKINELKKIFWQMNEVTFEIKNEPNLENLDHNMKQVLYIKVNGKTLEDMINLYHITPIQKSQLDDLLSDDYDTMWTSVIYGTPVGSPDMVQIALTQVGNVGGEPYWSWYGFKKRVGWCAIFVSWVADQAGLLDKGELPKFASPETAVNWFKMMNQWQEKDYIAKSGDIIFFDWENDNKVDHVGIVEKVENNKVYTIEGNSTNDTCRQKNYSLNSKLIYGYGNILI